MSVAAFLQKFKSAYDACGTYESGTMWLFRQLSIGPTKATVKAHVTITNSAKFYHEAALKFYYDVVQFLLRRYVADDIIAELDADVRSLRQGSMTPEEYTQELWRKTLSCGTMYDENSLKGIFMEKLTHPTRKTLGQW